MNQGIEEYFQGEGVKFDELSFSPCYIVYFGTPLGSKQNCPKIIECPYAIRSFDKICIPFDLFLLPVMTDHFPKQRF